ncbi:Inherit from proNOG: lipoprotein transmembrane [Seminavis robusta]|uniref:Inherit from proNOG: lipoprotein transmembrane n=1 Tax=Seminavis robusta TaxID=568900 RepID=A0A9N8DGH4_9STRA|nr:Inherit from proNOG: lipoprotein transmembrane [Seminavis robusta]|eukprot:Sro80_g043230.1 Inherit from proNOG: lipoprotein transmembrane (247) ;mRNA; r:91562-92302
MISQQRATRRLFLAVIALILLARLVEGSTQTATVAIEAGGTGEASVLLEEYSSHTAFHRSNHMPVSLEGVHLPAHHELEDGRLLHRNGHGLRSFTFYGLSMKMYVASVYSEMPIRNAHDALACTSCPLVFSFTFLRSVSQARVKFAWQKQLDWSVSHTYEGYDKDRAAFINMFGAMEDQGTVTVKFVDNETLVFDQGVLKGTIPGEDFQRAFLSMWFGEKAVDDDLKMALLGNTSSSSPQLGAATA